MEKTNTVWYATLTSKDGKVLDDCGGDRLLVEGIVKTWISILIEGDTIKMDVLQRENGHD